MLQAHLLPKMYSQQNCSGSILLCDVEAVGVERLYLDAVDVEDPVLGADKPEVDDMSQGPALWNSIGSAFPTLWKASFIAVQQKMMRTMQTASRTNVDIRLWKRAS
jgi:hypothetical protein